MIGKKLVPTQLIQVLSSSGKPMSQIHRGLTRLGWVFGFVLGSGICIYAFSSISEVRSSIANEYSLKENSDQIEANNDEVMESLVKGSISSVDQLWRLFSEWRIENIKARYSAKTSKEESQDFFPKPRSPSSDRDMLFYEFALIFVRDNALTISPEKLAQAIGNYEACLDPGFTTYRCARYSERRLKSLEASLAWAYWGFIWIPVCTFLGWLFGWSIWFLLSGFCRIPEK